MRIGVTDRLPVATLFCVQAFNSSQMGVYWPNFGTCIVVVFFDILISIFASVAIKSGGGNLATLHRRIAKNY